MYKRALILFFVMMAAFCFSFFSLDFISQKNNFREAAANQQSYKLKISDLRGTIYDCRKLPLVNTGKKLIAAVIPGLESLRALTPVVPEGEKEELYKRCSGNVPFTIEIEKDIRCELVKVFEVPVRYSGVTLAPHIIGYISGEKKGVSGVEKAYDDYLSGGEKSISVRYDVDACGKKLPGGKSVIEDKSYLNSKGIVLNLDSRIQAIAEECANKFMSRGAVLVTQVPDCEVRACVSLPSFSPGSVSKYLGDENSPFMNRAISAFNLGSIFKLVTAAAALKNGVSEDLIYECEGVSEVEDAKFKCFNRKKHGAINMKDAIAYSCNGYFIELIKNLVSKQQLLEMSLKFGLGQASSFCRGINSGEGKLPSSESLENKKALANFSFGQGKLLATPLQISGLINAIASGGVYTTPKLVKGFVGQDMRFTKDSDHPELYFKEQVISQQIAEKLKSFMKAAVDYGTAAKGKPENIEVAAKTSTAQTGILENGKRIEQSWYAGFFPYESPKYSVVVLCEAGAGGGESAGPIFREIAQRLKTEVPELFLE